MSIWSWVEQICSAEAIQAGYRPTSCPSSTPLRGNTDDWCQDDQGEGFIKVAQVTCVGERRLVPS